MIYERDSKEFFADYIDKTGVVLTERILATKNFDSKCYVDDNGRYFLSVNYGDGDIISVGQPYSDELRDEVSAIFPDAISTDFYVNGYIGAVTVRGKTDSSKLFYRYRFQGTVNPEIDANALPFAFVEINTAETELAQRYDDLYMSHFPPLFGARFVNQLKRLTPDKKIHFAVIDGVPVGHVITEYLRDYRACDFADIRIAEKHQRKGYGTALLTAAVCVNLPSGYDMYYTTVSAENTASMRTAEKAGFAVVTTIV